MRNSTGQETNSSIHKQTKVHLKLVNKKVYFQEKKKEIIERPIKGDLMPTLVIRRLIIYFGWIY